MAEDYSAKSIKEQLPGNQPGKIKKVEVDSNNKGVFDFIPLEPYTGVTKFVAGSSFTYSLQYRNNPTSDSNTKTYVFLRVLNRFQLIDFNFHLSKLKEAKAAQP